MNEIVIQIPIYKTAVLIYWGDRKGLYKAVKRNSDKATAREVIEEVAPLTEGVTVTTSGRTVTIYLASPTRPYDSGERGKKFPSTACKRSRMPYTG
nr:MAG TPA: CRS1 / YhbY (CRM) domain protein [Caudoviricetes sp.]